MATWSAFQAIRQRWEAAGSPRCEHVNTDKEYYDEDSGSTGDVGCLDCGTTWVRGEPKPEPEGVAQT